MDIFLSPGAEKNLDSILEHISDNWGAGTAGEQLAVGFWLLAAGAVTGQWPLAIGHCILHTAHCTFNFGLSTFDFGLSTFNFGLSTFDFQLYINKSPSVFS